MRLHGEGRPTATSMVMARNMQIVIQVDGKDRESYKVPTALA